MPGTRQGLSGRPRESPKTVFAYRDDGPMATLTRWQPRRIACTEHPDHRDRPGVLHVVKFRQAKPEGAAALISELLCTQLLAAGGVLVLDARIVEVSRQFAASCVTKPEIPYTIEPGRHFGTVLCQDVDDGPPLDIDVVANPQDVVDIWAFDSWFCNIDRNTHGNTLLTPERGGRFRLIAADQSDCFGGATRFADGSWRDVLSVDHSAETVELWQTAIFNAGGARSLHDAIAKVRSACEELDSVPKEWWKMAGVDPRLIGRALERRSHRLGDILKVKQWEGLDDATKDGRLF